jgi:succinyl-diaminopimelate desuccinylase
MWGEIGGCPYLLLHHKSPKLLFFAHIDVVPGSADQFSLKRVRDKLFARGSKDMKGATLPFLLAYREACNGGKQPPVSILLTSDEETAGPTIPTLLKEGKLNVPCAFTPDTGSNPNIVVECKGVVWANLIAQGRGSHAALPWEGENPIPLLSEAIRLLAQAFPQGSADEWQVTVTPTKLKGSDAHNKVPGEAHCSLDIRYPSAATSSARHENCSSPEEALKRVQDHLPRGCRLELVLSTPPLKTDPTHPMVQLVKRIGEEVTGKEVPIGREHGATDARYFSTAGIPAFLYGPEGGGIHSSLEWVSLSSLQKQYEISTRLLRAL